MREPIQDLVFYCTKCHFIGWNFHGVDCMCSEEEQDYDNIKAIYMPLDYLMKSPKWKEGTFDENGEEKYGFIVSDEEFKELIFGSTDFLLEQRDLIDKTVREVLNYFGLIRGRYSLSLIEKKEEKV